jgi:outer membrane protein TolC
MKLKYINSLTLSVIFILASALNACSYFAPAYQKPQLDLPKNWHSTNKNTATTAPNLPYLAWWQKFHDPVLNHLIESGLIYNSSIQTARVNLEAAQSQLNTIKLNWIPFVSLFGGYINGYNQVPAGNLGSFIAIMPQYTINFFNTYAQQQQMEHQVKVSEAEMLNVKLAVISQITVSYFAYLAQLQTKQQLQELNNKSLELITITTNLNQRGLATAINLSTLKSQQKLIMGKLSWSKKI